MHRGWWRKGLSWLAALVLAASLLPGGVAMASQPAGEGGPLPQGADVEQVMPNQMLVRFKAGILPQRLSATLQAAGATELTSLGAGEEAVHLVQVRDMASALPRLQSDPQVLYAEPNRVRSAVGAPNDPMYAQQWGLQRIHAEDGWSAMSTPNATPVRLAIVDTGVDGKHEDLQGRVLQGFNAFDGSTDTHDGFGHGTHVSGIAAAVTDNGIGIAGTAGKANIEILPVKVLGDDGSGSDYSVARGIRWAVDHGAQVIRM